MNSTVLALTNLEGLFEIGRGKCQSFPGVERTGMSEAQVEANKCILLSLVYAYHKLR